MKKNHKHIPAHEEQLVSLKRIEGQVRGINRMIEKREYCIDIINQIHAAMNALDRISEKIFERHLQTCVSAALSGRSTQERHKKIKEVLDVVHRMR